MSSTNVQFSVALHMMVGLSYYEGMEITSSTLAGSVNAAPSFVRQVLSKLSKHGLVVATRGKKGSCSLARKAGDISLLDVYHAVEPPPVFAIHPYPVVRGCAVSANIKGTTKRVLSDSQRSFEQSLATRTVADLVAEIGK